MSAESGPRSSACSVDQPSTSAAVRAGIGWAPARAVRCESGEALGARDAAGHALEQVRQALAHRRAAQLVADGADDRESRLRRGPRRAGPRRGKAAKGMRSQRTPR